jgi:poly[(R)-3-hydroxyalkanoate] polymerase subunit PhaC
VPSTSRDGQRSRLDRELERTLLRTRNGIRLVAGTRGPRIGATPKDVIWRRGRAELWRYHGGTVRYAQPILIVFSLVSRSYILDLRPGHSTVEFLVEQGFDVFLLDWGVPDERDAENTLETYFDTYLPRAVDAVRQETGCDEVTLAGYCLGGTLATLYASGHRDAPVRNLVLLACPIDFSEMGAMVAGVRDGRVEVDDVIDETGIIPAETVYRGFFMQAPTVEAARHATLLEHLWNDEYVDGWQAMAQWSRDHVPFAGPAARQIIDLFIRQNALMSGRIELGGREIRLGDARGEVLNAYAVKDNVVPPPAVEPNSELVGDPARRHVLRLGGGHVTFSTGRQAFGRTLPAISEWIGAHSDELETEEDR